MAPQYFVLEHEPIGMTVDALRDWTSEQAQPLAGAHLRLLGPIDAAGPMETADGIKGIQHR